MKNLRRNFERHCYRNRDKGIPNLMLWIAIGTIAVYFLMQIDPSNAVYYFLKFNRTKILHGQIWRLFTWILIPSGSGYMILEILMLFFYFQIGRAIEASWGRFKFNLFYLCGVILNILVGFLFNLDGLYNSYLNLSLILAFATLYPENRVMLMFIIPLKMKYLAWFYFVLIGLEVVMQSLGIFTNPLSAFAGIIYILVPLLNYFLFFGSDIKNLFSSHGRTRNQNFGRHHATNRTNHSSQRPNANWANGYQSQSGQRPYHHKCTICGKTDTEHPELEFRYCSRCNGYYCYCMEHINSHIHVQ